MEKASQTERLYEIRGGKNETTRWTKGIVAGGSHRSRRKERKESGDVGSRRKQYKKMEKNTEKGN